MKISASESNRSACLNLARLSRSSRLALTEGLGGGGGGVIFLTDKTSAPFQQPVYSSHAFLDKFSDGQLLWVREVTSYVAGRLSIFE